MPDKETTEYNAGEARMLLGHPLLGDALARLREDVVQAIEDNPLADEVMRDKYQITLQVVKQFKTNLYQHIEEAQICNIKQEEM